jgi:hypothetical protein
LGVVYFTLFRRDPAIVVAGSCRNTVVAASSSPDRRRRIVVTGSSSPDRRRRIVVTGSSSPHLKSGFSPVDQRRVSGRGNFAKAS